MNIKFNTKYCQEDDAFIKFGRYDNGEIAIQVLSNEGEPLSICTVALSHINIPNNHVIIKDYSENEGVLECLKSQNIIGDPIKAVPCRFVQVHICPLTKDAIQHMESKN